MSNIKNKVFNGETLGVYFGTFAPFHLCHYQSVMKDKEDLAKEMVKRLRAMEDDNFNNLQLMKHTRLYYLKEI